MTTLLVDGDSQSMERAGYVTLAKTWGGLVAARYGWDYINHATAGATSTHVYDRVQAGLATGADIIGLQVGINDCWRYITAGETGGNPAQSFQNNLINTIQAYQWAGKSVYVLSSFPFWSSPTLQTMPAYLRLQRTAAIGNGATFIDAYTVRLPGAPDAINNAWNWPGGQDSWCYAAYCNDVYHPNEAYHEATAHLWFDQCP